MWNLIKSKLMYLLVGLGIVTLVFGAELSITSKTSTVKTVTDVTKNTFVTVETLTGRVIGIQQSRDGQLPSPQKGYEHFMVRDDLYNSLDFDKYDYFYGKVDRDVTPVEKVLNQDS